MSALVDYRLGSWQQLPGEFDGRADLVICDPVYEDLDFEWAQAAAACLRPGGSLYAFNDFHGMARMWLALEAAGLQFLNHLVWPNDWGGRSRTRFGQKHDDILFFAKPLSRKETGHTFNSDAVAIPKKMVAKTFNPSGRTTKIPASVWDDIAGFSTTAAERVRIDGTCVRWQKPERVVERLVKASSNPGELVLDFFSGVATVPVVCERLGRRCVATELDPVIHAAGAQRLALAAR